MQKYVHIRKRLPERSKNPITVERYRRSWSRKTRCRPSSANFVIRSCKGAGKKSSFLTDFSRSHKGGGGVIGGRDEDSPNKAARLIWLQPENGRFHETVHTRIIRRNQPSRPASNNVNNWKSNQNRLLQFDGADWSAGYRLQSLQTACLPSPPFPARPPPTPAGSPPPISTTPPTSPPLLPPPPSPAFLCVKPLSTRTRNTSARMQTARPVFRNALCTPLIKIVVNVRPAFDRRRCLMFLTNIQRWFEGVPPSMREINVVERLKGRRGKKKDRFVIPDFYSKYYIEVLVVREKTFPL